MTTRKRRLVAGLAAGAVLVAAFEVCVYFAWGPWLFAFVPPLLVWADFMGRLSTSQDEVTR